MTVPTGPRPGLARIEAALRGLADEAPHPTDLRATGLAERALAGARQRRRRTGVLTVAGVAVAAAAVVLAVVLVQPAGREAASPASTSGAFAQPRQNVLLIGTDAGPGRIGARPDTIILASIDTRSGQAVLFGLPRSLEGARFPAGSAAAGAWPEGFRCADHACLLNSVWQWAETSGAKSFPGDRSAGLTATRLAVEGITGLSVDQTVVVTMAGLAQWVDAAGGVTVTVHDRLPIGGTSADRRARGWIEPGRQHLDGVHALWFVRSRWSTTDYSRMQRQQCLLSALTEQVDAPQLVRNFPELAGAAGDTLRTSIPPADLASWAELSLKVRTGGIRLKLLLAGTTADPDYPAMRRTVEAILHPAPGSDPDTLTARASAAPVTGSGGSASSSAISPC